MGGRSLYLSLTFPIFRDNTKRSERRNEEREHQVSVKTKLKLGVPALV